MTSTYDRVIGALKELQFDVEDIRPSTNLARDLNVDSLSHVEIRMALEEEFGIPEIPDDMEEVLNTVAALVAYVDARS